MTRPESNAPLLPALRAGTRELHVLAEKSGSLRELVNGRSSRHEYSVLLRNLLPAYEALEHGLLCNGHGTHLAALFPPTLYRAAAIRRDLEGLAGRRWSSRLPLSVSALEYAERIRAVAATEADRLLGHAYVRYLGDLSGGTVLRAVLRRHRLVPDDAQNFFNYESGQSIAALKAECLQNIAGYTDSEERISVIVDEARRAFLYNVRVSEATLEIARTRRAGDALPASRAQL